MRSAVSNRSAISNLLCSLKRSNVDRSCAAEKFSDESPLYKASPRLAFPLCFTKISRQSKKSTDSFITLFQRMALRLENINAHQHTIHTKPIMNQLRMLTTSDFTMVIN
jgi:hypothetical protein